MMKFKLALLCLLGAASANALACYTVYDRSNRVVYSGQTPPVDMSLPLHVSLSRSYPGGHMVFDGIAASCPSLGTPVHTGGLASEIRAANSGPPSPLLTDREVAVALNMPHTPINGKVALVPASAAKDVDFPTVNVVPADTAVARAPLAQQGYAMPATTQIMGAGLSPTQTMGAGPAPLRRNDMVITEMRNAPAVITYRGKTYTQR